MTTKINCCDSQMPDTGVMEMVRRDFCSKETMNELASIFKLMGEPARIGILHALSIHEMCVCDLAELLGMSHSAVSHQLRILRTARMVRFRKDGRKVVYSLNDRHVEILMRTAIDHMHGDGCPKNKD